MTTTFQKRQREMKKQEKQRSKAERRAQRKQAKTDGTAPTEDMDLELGPFPTDPTELGPIDAETDN